MYFKSGHKRMKLPTKLKIGFDTNSFSFYFEDGLGNVVDEHGNDPIEITENNYPFKIEELSSYNTYVSLRTKLVDVEVIQECQEEKPTINDEKLSSSS